MTSVHMEQIWTKLQQYSPPSEPIAEGWCYDQLLGAAFSLQRAAECGEASVDAYKQYRFALDSVRNTTPKSKEFAWGFYLNSGIHRVVWACERLLRFVADKDDRDDKFPSVIAEAGEKSTGRPALQQILTHFPVERRKNEEEMAYSQDPVTPDNILHILRGRVNRQKHWSRKAGQPTRGIAAAEKPWDKTSAETQYALVVHALVLLIDLFWETFPQDGRRQENIGGGAT